MSDLLPQWEREYFPVPGSVITIHNKHYTFLEAKYIGKGLFELKVRYWQDLKRSRFKENNSLQKAQIYKEFILNMCDVNEEEIKVNWIKTLEYRRKQWQQKKNFKKE